MNNLNGDRVLFKFWELIDDDVPNVVMFFIGVEGEEDLVWLNNVFA